ncbi:DegT/DnrJ/EryC1/StrS family aminotransferase [Salidesulfovibrio brasiliensis]|uniref:DegT/DnrJ/EryC1/StrS family aminotransferase n=1 Tax=Salidesulfovibrio brasiliensis TaxID=221711 RepID=UPI0006D01E57|nr:DegT/DnrJ/EryC1/StrS family aminotransferase [Salidesulfovibrio brasiliensis]
MKVEFYRHNLQETGSEELEEALAGVFLTTGPRTALFESELCGFMGRERAVGLMSCTHALELVLRYHGIGEGDEVVTTPMSFVATANAVEHAGARPVFVDVEPGTGNIDASRIEAAITPRTKAIMPVHLYGQLCDMRAIGDIARRHGLVVVEDAAHTFEARRDGIGVGELGAACLSFYATKNITSGEGGAVVCDDPGLADWLVKARLHGVSRDASSRYTGLYKHYDMDFLGYKSNMTDIQAALLLPQVRRAQELLNRRSQVAGWYDARLAHVSGVRVPDVLDGVHGRHLYTVLVDPARRDAVLHGLQDREIGVAVNYRPMHLMRYYREKYGFRPGDFPEAERFGDSTVTLPFYPGLSEEKVDYVVESLSAALEEAG